MEDCKVMMVIVNEEDAKLQAPLYHHLSRLGIHVSVVSTGRLCCNKNSELPEEALSELNVHHTSLSTYVQRYRTRNIARIVEGQNLDVLVIGTDQEYVRRAFVYAAKGYGIPVLLMEWGISSNTTNVSSIAIKRTIFRLRYYFANIVNKYLYLLRTVIALKWSVKKIIGMIVKDIQVAFTVDDARGSFGYDAIAIAGNWEKHVLVERGVNPGDIYVVGNPRLKFTEMVDNTDNARRKLGIKTAGEVILLLTSAFVEHGRWSVDMRDKYTVGIIDALSPILTGSTQLLIKIHPEENLAVYNDIVRHRKENVRAVKDVALADAINASDLVIITGYSTTVLVACTLRKPVILPIIFSQPNHMPFEEMGLCSEVNDLGELKGLAEGLLYNQSLRGEALHKSQAFLDSNKEFTDGKATERITELILKMAGK